MNAKDPWQRFRASLYDNPELGFRLDLSRMDLPEDHGGRMAAQAGAAVEAMAALESGAIANPDEQRMVGHYWLRAPELAPTPEIGRAIRETRKRVEEFAGAVLRGDVRPARAERFEQLLVIGIGGSALGPQFVATALGEPGSGLALRFLDNADPDGIDRTLGRIDLATTLTCVISKSGGTPETRNGMLETAAAYEAGGLELGPHAVAITQEGSKLDRFATEQGFLERLPMWDWVGGRTSELSAVGLLPAALGGIDVEALCEGAAAMDRATRGSAVDSNPALMLALAWFHTGEGRGKRDMVILPYRDRLALLSRYLQQLVMESLGKKHDLDGMVVHQGLAVYGNKGSTDQHAYVQQLRDGLPNFFATFIEVLRDRDRPGLEVEPGITAGDYLHGFLMGTRGALHESGRPSLTLTLRELDARSVGMLIALYERAVGFYASLIHVNAYNQPGVEAGKKAAAAVLDLQRSLIAALRGRGDAGGTAADLAREIGSDDVESTFLILERLAANPGRGVRRGTGPSAFEATFHHETHHA